MSATAMKKSAIVGINAVVAMPFTAHGQVDFPAFDRLLAHLIGSGINGATLFGIASEFHKLSDREKDLLAARFLSAETGEPFYRVLSVTEHATELAVQRARQYQAMGVDALMLLPPFFLKPTTEDVLEHVFCVLEAVSIPVFVQYAPTETGRPITPSEMARIAARYPHAIFKIECNPPVDYVREFLQLVPDAAVMNGYAGLYMPDILDAGGCGVMPGCSFGEVYVAIYRHWQGGEHDSARELHARLLPYLRRWMAHPETIIQSEKTILKKRRIIESDYCRKPAYTLTSEDLCVIDEFLENFAHWLTPTA